ncbi:MAG: DNRLRE domain-containing protein [Bacteroidota bacterium]
MKVKFTLVFIFLIQVLVLRAQTKIVLRPGAEGKDASVQQYRPTDNLGNRTSLEVLTWTFSGEAGTKRSLLEFNLSAIPTTALVTSAKLYLYHNDNTGDLQHSTMSGSNAGLIQRVTTPWQENTVNWNTQPTSTATNQASIPASTSAIQDYVVNVTGLVQGMVSNPSTNYGFLIKLATEAHYRALMFASSDNANPSLRPQLEIEYTIPSYQQEIDQVIAALNKSQITTGILYDRAFPLADLEAFTGGNDTDTSSSDHFRQAYHELYNASFNTTGLISGDQLTDQLTANAVNGEHAIGILYRTFNTIDTLAVKKNLLRAVDGKLYDVVGRSASPYLTHTTFVASPLDGPGTELIEGSHAFYVNPSYFFTPAGVSVNSVSVDFGNGQGVQTIHVSGLSTQSRSAALAGFPRFLGNLLPGVNFIRFSVTFNDGKILQAIATLLAKKKNPASTTIGGCNGGDTFDVVGYPFDASAYGKPYGSAQGTAHIFYSDANCGTGRITKPIIFIDGFDPDNKRDVKKIYDDFINLEYTDVNGNKVRLGQKIRSEGYDLIVYNYRDGADLLERNGRAVAKLLGDLYSRYSGSIQQDFVLIGPSMGALVAQYALAWSEKNNIAHHTRLYISFDGPHQGANIAIGMQQFIDYILERGIVGKVMPDAKNGLHKTNAARQMLMHHSNSNSEIPMADTYRAIFLTNLNAVGTYPSLCRKVAIINGSRRGRLNPFHTPCEEMLRLEVRRRGIFGACNGDLCRKIDWHVYSSTQSSKCKSLDMWTAAPLMNLTLWRDPSEKKYSQSSPLGNSYDIVPGSYFGELIEPKGKTQAFADLFTSLNYLFTGRNTTFRHNINNFSFIPTVSAADIQPAGTNLYYDFSNEILAKCSGITPFDMVYAPDENEAHVAITGQNAIWFENEIKGVPAPPVGPPVLNGPDNVMVNMDASFTVNIVRPTPLNRYTWSVPPGWLINGRQLSPITIGTGSVTLKPTSSAVSGQVCVTVSGGCYSGATVCKNVTVTQSVRTIVLRPGAEGKDASVQQYRPADNLGNRTSLEVMTWTFSGEVGTKRSLLEFNLSAIPTTALVTSAKLYLYHNDNTGDLQHSTMSGSNAGLIQRVTTPWQENTVNWNTQPTSTATNQASIPASTSAIQDYVVNVTGLVQGMVSNPSTNYGFLIKLATEAHYRALMFASSDNANPSLRPQLQIDYVMSGRVASAEDSELNTNTAIETGLTAHPNPFTNSTKIAFKLPSKSEVTLSILNSMGKIVKQVTKELESGYNEMEWDAEKQQIAAGMYIGRVQCNSQVLTTRLLYVK